MKRKYLIISLIILVIFGIGFFIIKNRNVIPVKKITPENKTIRKTISASGRVKSENEADLSFASMGRINTVYVTKGQKVTKGQYLAVIENYSDANTLQALKDSRDLALRDKDLFLQNYEENLDSLGSQEAFDLTLRKYDENISKAEATYQAQFGNINKTYIYAPFDGTIIDIYKKQGETATIAEKIIKIADLRKYIFEIQLDQKDYGYLVKNQKVDITLDSFENEKFGGIVKEIPTYIDTSTNSDFILKIKFADGNLKKPALGMDGDAFIVLAETSIEVPSLPFDEIYTDEEGKNYVYVLNGNKAEKVYIELGLEGDLYTEIKTQIDKPIIIPIDPKKSLLEGTQVVLR